jgi:anti-sigma B factor antagonist
MKLQLMSIERDGMVKIATQGNITSADIDAAGPNPLEQILGKNWFQSRVLLDMGDTQYIDSSAIGWLIGTARHLKDGSGSLVVYGIQPSVRQVLDLLKVGRVVPLVEDETAAKQVAGAAGSAGGGGQASGSGHTIGLA